MTTAFGFFKKIDGSDRYTLNQIVTSPYETERMEGDLMVRDISKFDFSIFNVLSLVEEGGISKLFSFGEDNSVQLRTDISSVVLIEEQTSDPVNGINKIEITIDNAVYTTPYTSDIGTYLRSEFPNGYTAP